jgi:DNA mismatch endonuclease, patch repair protein
MAYNQEDRIKVPRFSETNGFYTTRERSEMMAKIRSKHTKPEIILRKVLFGLGIRYRISPSHIPGRPDIWIQKYKIAIFVDGEFWHGKDWEKCKVKSNIDFWEAKIQRNRQRDKEVNRALLEQAIVVFRFWSKEIKSDLGQCLGRILEKLE